MKTIWDLIKRSDIGEMGIGAMIVFIAMVLVAGIAAYVLVQTANRLELQAMNTGEQTKAEVSTGVRIVDIEGHKTTRFTYSRIHNLTITVAPRAGSRTVDMSTTVVEIANNTRKCILAYAGTAKYKYQPATTGIFGTSTQTGGVFEIGAYQFGLVELEDADNSSTAAAPVLNRGDKVMITINATACFTGISERTDIWGRVIPEEGAPGFFSFRTPATYTVTIFDLF